MNTFVTKVLDTLKSLLQRQSSVAGTVHPRVLHQEDQWGNLSLEEQDRLLRLWRNNPCYAHFMWLVGEQLEHNEQLVLGYVPESIFDLTNREQSIGERNGLRWLPDQIQSEANRIAREVQMKNENANEPEPIESDAD